MSDQTLCVIAFQGEAHDSAETMYGHLETWCVQVVPTEGEPFDAEVGPIDYDEETGFQFCTFYVWDREAGKGDRNKPVRLDIFDGIDRIEVY